jgi:hypothetical protein
MLILLCTPSGGHVKTRPSGPPAIGKRIFRALLAVRDQIVALDPKYQQMVRDEANLMSLLERALDSHDAATGRYEANRPLNRGS